MILSHTFRGQEIDIDVTRKVEPYEWRVLGLTIEQENELRLTDAEEGEIYALISNALYEQAANWCPEDD